MSKTEQAREDESRCALADMTQPEFQDAVRFRRAIIIPLGSVETQGPQAPMGDYRLSEQIAFEAARRSDAICAPPLPFGYAEFFRSAPGGIQLRAKTFSLVLEDMITSFLDHGIDHVILCNGHSSNAPLISNVTHKIRIERGIYVPSLNIWRAPPTEIRAKAFGDGAAELFGHGGEPITSAFMYFQPGSVRTGKAVAPVRRSAFGLATTSTLSAEFDGAIVDLPLTLHDVAANGSLGGDGSRASAAAGAVLCEWIIDWVAAFTRHFKNTDARQS